MQSTTAEDKQTDQDTGEAGAVTGVVVPGASPEWKSVLKKVVVARTTLSTKNISDNGQAGKTFFSTLLGLGELRFGELLLAGGRKVLLLVGV